MGAWGVGLYAGDFSRDLRPMVGALAQLPIDGDRITELACERFVETSRNPQDEDHTIFWLVLADQCARRHIDAPEARGRALAIIDSGADLVMHRDLGMSERDLGKRASMLQALRPTLAAPVDGARRRGVLRKPQPLLMALGDCFVFPTSKGKGINSYYPSRAADRSFHQDGWGAAVVCELGRAFGYLAWYRLCVLDETFTDPPDVARIRAGRFGPGLSAGTCSPTHFKRMELAKIGSLPVVEGAIRRAVPELVRKVRTPETAAILDVSLCNNLRAGDRTFQGPFVTTVLGD
jgi:hypothetical protein